MSQTFRTPDKSHYRKRVIIKNKYTSSTPCGNGPAKHYSISLSGIDTASSSSGGKTKRTIQSPIPEKRKSNLKNKKNIHKRRRIVTQSGDTDSEWETRSENSATESFTRSQEFIPNNCNNDLARCYLFEDPGSPEQIRDVPIEQEFLHESPILQSSRNLHLISGKNDIVQCKELLPITNIPSMEIRKVYSEIGEDEVVFRRCLGTNNMKTYGVLSKRKKNLEQKSGNFLFGIRFPTASSDLLWDQFICKHHNDVSQYLASFSIKAPIELSDSKRGLPKINKKSEIAPVSLGMERIRGYWDETLHQWISHREQCNTKQKDDFKVRRYKDKGKKKREKVTLRSTLKQKTDVYDQSDETDYEFEKGGHDGKRISLNEFRCKQKRNEVQLNS